MTPSTTKPIILSSTADRRLNILDANTNSLMGSLTTLHDSAILSSLAFGERLILTTSMSGQLILSDLTGKILDQRRDHSKFCVSVKATSASEGGIVATAGWVRIPMCSSYKKAYGLLERLLTSPLRTPKSTSTSPHPRTLALPHQQSPSPQNPKQ